VHLFLIETFLLEQDDPLQKNYSIMEKVNRIFFGNETLIMQFMLNHVLSQKSNQMLHDQKSTLVNDV